MAIRIALPRTGASRPGLHRLLAVVLVAVVTIALAGAAVFGYYFHKYGQIVDQRLEKPLFVSTAQIYAAARQVRTGQRLTAAVVAQQLRTAGYTDDSDSAKSERGTFSANQESITIRPGPQSFHAPEAATITFDGGKVQQITATNGEQLASYALEPLLITGLSDETRTKRHLVTYQELPQYLVPAVTAIEDRRFFAHGGVDYIRMVGAARADLLHHGYHGSTEGGSTLTMQLARGFFLSPAKHIKRKLLEIMITWHLESRFNKQQIFQMYANEIPLGQAGSFAINGFGEAAQTYFGKDVSKLNLPECALLAGMIQSPSRLNPMRHPVRAVERRNVVLDAMVEAGAISKEQAEEAKASPLRLASQSVQQNQAPYFVDLVRDQVAAKLGDSNWNQEGLRIYTSLDPQLQEAASAAVEAGMKHVDELVDHLHAKDAAAGTPITYPQVALIALDPHTGQVLALVGGRNYGQSQLNHATSHRPTGSIFKPFVYASAFNSSLAGTELANTDGTTGVFTQVMMLPNEQQTFNYGNGQTYTPRNFHGEYTDEVTAQFALKRSMNNATIALGQMVGFGNVAALARDAGIISARATPAVALGSYDATPLEMAGAYTVFANNGTAIKPWMLASIRSANGDPLQDFTAQTHPVLDPRVAYLTTNMMQAVLSGNGTGAGVRAMGFSAPAAGKTGTSRDAWFAGYTSNLLCIIWVGNDDYSDIKLQGADAAGPIWGEFMKRAVALPQYSDTHDFAPPSGVSLVRLDKATNLLADASCPDNNYTAAFLDGTQPTGTCDAPGNDQRNIFQKLFGIGHEPQNPQQQQPVTANPQGPQAAQPQQQPPVPGAPATTEPALQPAEPTQEKKPGFFGKLFGHKPKDAQPQPQPQPQE
ncbi:transglycosylase domain-containing protein [Acidipila sp. EB88]|uniref:transglycosylase domain-containing protein n=1 Tax=Acidipila sp. EB88 TaxID=2305226 RepID=UPI000F5F32F3|nr:transglycosylase domain-containing protein [Acidipila sp. EB88]RRA48751.1 penicillin-binding protein [Acidipila sp. EB88]